MAGTLYAKEGVEYVSEKVAKLRPFKSFKIFKKMYTMKLNKYSFSQLIALYMLGISPFCMFIGLLSLFKIVPVFFNQKEYFGIAGMLIGIGIGIFMSVIMAIFSYIFLNFGLLIYKKLFVKR